ncbi:hypothetical protein CXG81DRAFT_28125 [Caulochytrium protostelioides]|uniref:Bax inhibitor family protein n=1 Tax=Caulochytrium protostelioides TaxID=1555241 RepID=A0A4P9X1M0_9FUNG|nr:hypothetical protein CXG81DRAFT_28125 [Caulochytrium protostelioides]|eukprot:RKO99092.1 hypothetical protein CXG81DRAFT_28125 [Caulochytrium protostelioides]
MDALLELIQEWIMQAPSTWADLGLPLTPAARSHILRVYGQFGLNIAVTGAALVASLYGLLPWPLNGALSPLVLVLGILGLHLWFASVPPIAERAGTRRSLLLGSAALQGALLHPIAAALDAASRGHGAYLVTTAALSVLCIFASLSLSVLYAPNRRLTALGGLLGAAVSVLGLLQFGALFAGADSAVHTVELWLGVMVFAGFIVVDTQAMVQRTEHHYAMVAARRAGAATSSAFHPKAVVEAHPDALGDTAKLYTDAMGLFVRLLLIALRRQRPNRDDDDDDGKRRRGGRRM